MASEQYHTDGGCRLASACPQQRQDPLRARWLQPRVAPSIHLPSLYFMRRPSPYQPPALLWPCAQCGLRALLGWSHELSAPGCGRRSGVVGLEHWSTAALGHHQQRERPRHRGLVLVLGAPSSTVPQSTIHRPPSNRLYPPITRTPRRCRPPARQLPYARRQPPDASRMAGHARDQETFARLHAARVLRRANQAYSSVACLRPAYPYYP